MGIVPNHISTPQNPAEQGGSNLLCRSGESKGAAVAAAPARVRRLPVVPLARYGAQNGAPGMVVGSCGDPVSK